MHKEYTGPERRRFPRTECISPLAYKVCKKETLTKLLHGYTVDVSQSGMLCRINEKVNTDDILWLAFDKAILDVCKELENKCFIYQNGVIGRVARVEKDKDDIYMVGINFITSEEKNSTNIYPKIHFLKETKE